MTGDDVALLVSCLSLAVAVAVQFYVRRRR